MIERSFKLVLKQILFLLFSVIPRRSFDHLVYRFALMSRAKSRMGFYAERLVNYVNRQIIIQELVQKGIWCQPVEGIQSKIYDYVFNHYSIQPLDYLEFGVYRGESIQWWLSKLSPNSNLFGFDSFEGLPDDWYYGCPKGTFHVGNEPPIIAPNLRFVKGWFEKSLVPFLAATSLKHQLILHMDASL